MMVKHQLHLSLPITHCSFQGKILSILFCLYAHKIEVLIIPNLQAIKGSIEIISLEQRSPWPRKFGLMVHSN